MNGKTTPEPENNAPLSESTEPTPTQNVYSGVSLIDGEEADYIDPEDCLEGDDLEKFRIDEAFDNFTAISDDTYKSFEDDRNWIKLARKLWEVTRSYFGEPSRSIEKNSHEVQKYYEFHQEQANGLLSYYLHTAMYDVFDRLRDGSPDYLERLLRQQEDKYAVVNATSLGQSPLLFMYGLFITTLKRWPDLYEDWRKKENSKTSDEPPRL